jgi:endonuclease-3
MAPVVETLRILAAETRRGRYRDAAVYRGPIEGQPTPFRALVGCLISQRARDEQTAKICERLFAEADTPGRILAIPPRRLRAILYGSGFYRTKARRLREICRALVASGRVPPSREELLRLPGIGPKCANLVLAKCFGEPRIAVDTHVHRISNRFRWVRTKTPEKTEAALTPRVPVAWRRRVNALLVAHGQTICKPIGPRCNECPVRRLCPSRHLGS